MENGRYLEVMDTNGDLRTLLRRTGHDLKHIANLIGLSPSGLSKRLSGERDFRVREVADLHKAIAKYGVKISEGALMRLCLPQREEKAS
jgi:hypothetical protein